MITNFFPLSVYREKLRLDAATRDRLRAIVREQTQGPQKRGGSQATAWTGDVEGKATLHLMDDLAPMVEGFRLHTLTYLSQLGHKTESIDIYITRCWGTFSEGRQAINAHNHRNSALSIVYYLSLPTGSATLAFHNREIQNEILPGFSHPDRVRRGHVDGKNVLSAFAVQMPVAEDDIVIFPSAAFHGVRPGNQDSPRMSIAADTFIVERELSGEEYLLPPLSTWRKMT